ncbi:MAG: SU10 major capsid protein, partial [Casimicrobium sp.]
RTMWENGGTPRACYLTLGQKAVVNAFPGIADRRVDVKPGGKVPTFGVVAVYIWETGPIAFIPIYQNRLRTRTMLITDGESVKRGYLRPITRLKPGVTGDNSKDMIVTDTLVKVTNRRGICKVADLS